MGKENTEKKRGRGRPKTYETFEDFERAVKTYVEACEADNVFPDEAGLRLHLGLTKRTIDAYCSEETNPESFREYRDLMSWAQDKRESFLVRRMTSDNNTAQGCLNALKQPSNGGYIDRPMDSGKIELNIKVDGIGGMSMFK